MILPEEKERFDAFCMDGNNLPFLDYVYSHIVSPEFPASTILLSVLKARTEFEAEFYRKILSMEEHEAQKELGIGAVSSKEVTRLCSMMRRIVSFPGSRNIFEKSQAAEALSKYIDGQISQKHIRLYHSYQRYMDSCEGSVVKFYLKIAGLSNTNVKFDGLNSSKSLELYESFLGILAEIDTLIEKDNGSEQIFFKQKLSKMGFKPHQIDEVSDFYYKHDYFPLFKALDFFISNENDRTAEMAQRCVNCYEGSIIEDMGAVAKSMSISRERVRQLRNVEYRILEAFPRALGKNGNVTGDQYLFRSTYDIKVVREIEEVHFSDVYMIFAAARANTSLKLIGNPEDALFKAPQNAPRLYVIPDAVAKFFNFEDFVRSIELMLKEKRYFEYRDDLEIFVRNLVRKHVNDDMFYNIVRECRFILQQGYPENIINNQLFFPANARKNIPYLIEDILREMNRPMTAEEICDELNSRYPDLEQTPKKIGPNALRNSNIIAVSRTSTYALTEWNYTEKRGGTIRDIVEEYLNSLIEPIAPLTDICEYVSKFRDNVKEDSVKANLLAESSNKFSLYYKDDELYIGYTEYEFSNNFSLQEKRQGRRTFTASVELLEKFIIENQRFPYSSGVNAEEARLNRFLGVCRGNIRKGKLTPEEQAEIERIETQYEHLKGKKERVSWMQQLENYVTYITLNECLPTDSLELTFWYEESLEAYNNGTLEDSKKTAFTTLKKIVERMQ